MTRRESLQLSAVAMATAILTGCPKGSNTDPREKRRAHATAMFLLVLHPSYLQEALSNTPQDQLPGASLLLKVMPPVFASMRTYFQAQSSALGMAALVQKYKDIRDEMYNASSSVQPSTGAPTSNKPPYSTPDECPCVIDHSCPQVEALLQF
jgi:hypothetical protein